MIDSKFFTPVVAPEPREIELADGTKANFYFKPLSAADARVFANALVYPQTAAMQSNAFAYCVSRSICELDGSPALTFDQAAQLKDEVFNQMINIIVELSVVRNKAE